MPGIKFDTILNHDPFVKSANAIVSAVNKMSAFVQKAGGDIGNVFKRIADGGQTEAVERRAQSIANVFIKLVGNIGIAGDAADAARDRIKKAMDDFANSTERPKAKFQKFATELSTILNDIKSIEAPLGNTSTTAAIPALEKRLKLESDILAVLEQQKAAAEQQRNVNSEGLNRNKTKLSAMEDSLSKKYNGAAEGFYDEADIQLLERGREAVANWTKAWEDSNAQVQTCDALIAESNARTEQMKHSVEELNNVYKGFANTAESTANKVFLDESKFERYEQLKARIKELKEQIVKIGEGDDVDVPKLHGLQEELRENQEEFEALDRAARKTAEGLGTELSGKVQSAMANLFKHQQIVRNAEEEYKKLKTQLDEAQKKLSDAKEPTAITTAQKEVDRLRVLLTAADDRLSRYKANLTDAKKESDRLQSSINGNGKDFSSSMSGMLKNAAAVAGVGFGIAQAKQFGQQIMAVRGQFQQLEVAFKTMLGSEEKAVELMEQLTKTAAITPFDLQGVTQGAKQLLAYGISADKVNDTLIHLGDIAAGLSLPLGDLVYLYGTTMTQGRMFTQDLRQFMGRGIPIAEELAKQFGVTKDKVGALVTAGKVGAEEFNKAIMAMSSEGGKFAGLMEAQSKTISGQISNIGDAIDNMFNNIGKSSEGIINGALSGVSYLVENYEKVGKVIAEVVAIYGTYKAAIIAYNAISKAHAAWIALEETAHLQNKLATEAETAAKGRATVATVLLDKAQKTLSATMLANPYVLAATAIAALAVVVYNLATAESAAEAGVRKANDELQKQSELLNERKNNINNLINTIRDHNQTSYAQLEAYKKLKSIAPEITDAYTQEKIAMMGVDEVQKLLNKDFDDVNYDKAKKNVEEYTQRVERLNKNIEEYINSPTAQIGDKTGAVYSKYLSDLEKAKSKLKTFQKVLSDIEKTQKDAELNARPIEIRVKEANENYQVKQNVLNFYDKARTLAQAVEDADYEMSTAIDANGKTNHDVAIQRFDDFINKVESELKDPMTLKYGNDTEEVSRFVKELKQLKASWQGMFNTPIFVNFALRFDQAKKAVEDAISGTREGMHFVESAIGNEINGGIRGYWQANVDETKTYSEKVKEATDAINTANANLRKAIKQNAKDNGKAVKDAREAVETAKKNYKDLTGESFGKGSKEGQKAAKERAAAKANEKQQAQKNSEEMIKLELEAERAREDAKIAGIKSAAKREREERQEQHKRTIEDIKRQEEDIYKKIYQDRKTAYDTANKGKKNPTPFELTDLGDPKKWNEFVKNATTGIKAIQDSMDSLDPSQLEAVFTQIDNLDLSKFQKEEQKIIRETYKRMVSNAAESNAEFAREEENRLNQLLQQHQSYTDQKIAIEKRYADDVESINVGIAEAEKKGDTERVEALKRSLAEVEKERAKSQAALSLAQLKETPDYIRAFEDLDNTSTETIQHLIREFERLKSTMAETLTPDQFREVTRTIESLYEKLRERDPFGNLIEQFKEFKKNTDELNQAQNKLGLVQNHVKVVKGYKYNKKTNQLEEEYLSEEEAKEGVRVATDNQTKAQNKLRKALGECSVQIESFGNTLKSLGDTIGGDFGNAVSGLGDVFSTVGGAYNNLSNINWNAKGVGATMNKVSAVIGTAQAMYEMNMRLDSMLPNTKSLYEHYAQKQAEINEERLRILNLEIELLKKRQAAENWIARTQLQDLSDKAKLNAEYIKGYAKVLSAPQEIYKEASSGLSKWAGAIIGAIAGIIIAVVTYGAGAGVGAAVAGGISSALAAAGATTAVATALAPIIGALIVSGVTAAIGNVARAGVDRLFYREGQTSALNNMRVQTQHASFWRGEETQDLEDWVREHYGKDLYEKVKAGAGQIKLLNTEVAKAVLESGETLVGETRNTLEKALEYSEKIKEFIDDVREYVDDAFGPLSDNLVSSLMDWLNEGKDVLDSFREYAADTFNRIAQEAMKTMANKLIFQGFQEQLEDLVIAYGTNQLEGVAGLSNEENFMLGVASLAGDIQEKVKEATPVLQKAMTIISSAFEEVGINITESKEVISDAFSDIASEFKSTLLDMENDADDFAKKITKKLYEALTERLVINKPITVNIEGEDTVFKNLDAYLSNWSDRHDSIIKTITPEEQASGIVDYEEQIKSVEAQIERTRSGYDTLIHSYEYQLQQLKGEYGNLLAGRSKESMTAEELAAYEKMLEIQERINNTYSERDSKIAGYQKQIEKIKKQIEELRNSDTLTEEEIAEKEKALNEELEQTMLLLKQIVRTYADMSGFTMEQKIDASPFANLGDDLLSVLQDTSKSVEDWKDDIVKVMTDDLIKEVVYNDNYKSAIRSFQEMYVNAMSGNTDDLKALLAQYEDVWDEAGNLIWNLGTTEGKQSFIEWLSTQMANFATTTAQSVDGIKKASGQAETSFGDMHDTFMDAILDMESGAENLKKKLNETLVKDLIEKTVFKVPLKVTIDGKEKTFEKGFDEYQEDWTKRYYEVYNSTAENREQLLQALIDELLATEESMAGAAADLAQRVQQAKYTTLITDMTSGLVSALMDMDGDIDDFANDMKKTIVQNLVEGFMVSDKIKPILDGLQKEFNSIMDDKSLSPDERAAKIGEAIDEALPADTLQGWQDIVRKLMEAIGYQFNETAKLFDDLGDRIKSSLTSAGGSAEDFLNNLTQAVVDDMTDAYMATDEFKNKLKDVQDNLRAAAEELEKAKTPEEIEAASQKFEKAQQEAKGLRDEVDGVTESVRNLQKTTEIDTTFKEMGEELVSALQDNDTSFEDWSQTIGKKMADKIFHGMMGESKLLDKIQTAFNDTVKKYTDIQTGTIDWKGVMADEDLSKAVADGEEEFEEYKNAWNALCAALKIKPDFSNALGNLEDTLLDTLLDVEKSAGDMGKEIGQTLIKEMLQQMLKTGAYADQINAFKEIWQKVLTSDSGSWTDENGFVWTVESLIAAIEQLETTMANDTVLTTLFEKFNSYGNSSNPFSNMRDNFVSSLISMEGDAESFGKNIAKDLTKQMVDKIISNNYQSQIDQLGNDWAKALDAGDTKAIATISEKLKGLYGQMGDDVQPLLDAIKDIEKQLDTTFSGMTDSWVSALMDMEGTADDFAKTVGKTMAQKILTDIIAPVYIQPLLNQMQDTFNAVISQVGATWQEAAAAMRPYLQQVKEAYYEVQPMVQELLGSFDIYKESVQEAAEEVEYALQDLKSNFVSSLMDMTSSAEDFSKEISKILAQNWIENYVLGAKFDRQMEYWKKQYESIIGSGMSEAERKRQLTALRDSIATAKQSYVNQAMAIQELLGITADGNEQQATMNMADKITYDQADQLLGVNIAQQLTLEQILATLQGGKVIPSAYTLGTGAGLTGNDEQSKLILANLQSMSAMMQDRQDAMLTQVAMANSYLQLIRDYNKQIRDEVVLHMASMDNKLTSLKHL